MKFRTLIATTAVTLATVGVGISAAQAQTLTLTAYSHTGTTYSYTLTPVGFSPNYLIFNFADANVSFLSVATTASGQLALTANPISSGAGVFSFDSGTLGAGSSETFNFTSSDAEGANALGLTSIQFAGAAVASLPNQLGPVAAPEPGSVASMGVLTACLSLGIIARKRKARSL